MIVLVWVQPGTNKKRSETSYSLEGTVLKNVNSIKYPGVTIIYDLIWNTHVSNMYTKANRTLDFLSQNLYQYPQDIKEAVVFGVPKVWFFKKSGYKRGSCVWDPKGVVLQEEIENVWNRTARFVISNYCFETGSMTRNWKT